MKMAIIKKYFRLACYLLKYKSCKNYLNQYKTNDQDYDYMFMMNKFQLQEKMKVYDAAEKEDNKDKNEVNQNYFKLLSLSSSKKENYADLKKEILHIDTDEVNLDNNKNDSRIKRFGSMNNNRISEDLLNINNLYMQNKKKPISYKSLKSENGATFFEKRIRANKSGKTNRIDNPPYSEENNFDFDDRSLFNPEIVNNVVDSKKNIEEIEMVNTRYLVNKSSLQDNLVENSENLVKPSNKLTEKIIFSMLSGTEHPETSKNQNSIRDEDLTHKPKSSINNDVNKEKQSVTFQDLITSKKSINVQIIIIDHLRYGQHTFYCLCLLSSISERYLITEYSDKICKYLIVFTRDNDAISKSRYPLILCVLGAEFLIKLGKLNSKYQYKCNSIAEMLLNLAECLQSSIRDEEMLNYYLREQTDHNKRSALEIIAENRFYELLKDENVAAIVGKLWYGKGRDLSINKFCRITRVLGANIRHEHYKDVISYDFKGKSFSFQYSQYTKNCSVRYLVDSISTISTTILYQLVIYFYVSIFRTQVHPNDDPFFVFLNNFANVIVCTINLNLIMYIVHVHLTNKTLKMTAFIFLDILMFLGVLCNYLNVPEFFYSDDENMENFLHAFFYSVIIFCSWMRVIEILITTRFYGPFLRIIYLLLSTILNFLLILFAFNTVFAQVFTILFKGTNKQFKGFFTSWITLFNTCFGINNFINFTKMNIFGYSLLIAYTTLTNIMLLNLVVAIINNLFQYFVKKADAENRAVLVLTYERIKWDEEYGVFILLPAPFNLISFPLALVLIFVKDVHKKKLNKIFSKICYIVVALANFLILIILSLVCLPFAYIKSLIHSAYENFNKFSIVNLHYALFHITCRPFIFIFYILEDIINFWKLCYSEDINEYKEDHKNFINKDIILALRKLLFDHKFKTKKKVITYDELSGKLGLNKIKKFNIVNKSHSNSSLDGSESDYSGDNSSYNGSSNHIRDSFIHDETTSFHDKNYSSLFKYNHSNSEELSTHERNSAFRYLIDKIVDKDGLIDIERTLLILPSRVKYNENFINSMKYVNVRVILRGLQKYLFINAINNPVFSYKKLQQLIYKILIKFKMIYYFLPENQMNKVRDEFINVNEMPRFSKDINNLIRMEHNDEFSDDDQEIFDEFSNYRYTSSNNNNYSNLITNDNLNSVNSDENKKFQ